jgi:hypothetical protein
MSNLQRTRIRFQFAIQGLLSGVNAVGAGKEVFQI